MTCIDDDWIETPEGQAVQARVREGWYRVWAAHIKSHVNPTLSDELSQALLEHCGIDN